MYSSFMSASPDRVRVDKWLWAARFFKTRSQASEAVDGGKVEVNGARVKPAKDVRIGDELRIRLGPYEHHVVVRALSDRRGPATVAQSLYEETPDSIAARAKLREEHRLAPAMFVYEEKGRPTKKDRRALASFIERRRRR
jgi:ribosome-associated heat shock protein Hsp15